MAGMHGVCTGHTQQDAGTSSQQILCFCCNLLLRCFLLFTGIPCHGHSSIMHRKCGESMVPKPLCPHQRTASCVLSWATPPHLEEMWVFISFHCFMPISFKTFYLTHPFSIPYFQGYQRDPLLKYNIPMSSINHSSLGCCILNSLSLPPLSCMSLFLTGLNPQLHDPCSTLVWDFLSWLSALPFTSHSLPSPPNLAVSLLGWSCRRIHLLYTLAQSHSDSCLQDSHDTLKPHGFYCSFLLLFSLKSFQPQLLETELLSGCFPQAQIHGNPQGLTGVGPTLTLNGGFHICGASISKYQLHVLTGWNPHIVSPSEGNQERSGRYFGWASSKCVTSLAHHLQEWRKYSNCFWSLHLKCFAYVNAHLCSYAEVKTTWDALTGKKTLSFKCLCWKRLF